MIQAMHDYDIYIETEIKGPLKVTAQYGYVIELRDKENVINTLSEVGCLREATCHRLEVAAVHQALKKIPKRSRVTIYTDSIYLQSAFTKDWIGEWQAAGWKNRKNKQVKNDDIWKLVAEKAKIHDLAIVRQQKHQYSAWLLNQMQKIDIEPGKSRIIEPT